MNPFDALGLPARHDLTDEQVRAAWRAIAADTHPDRADGGDVARYTAATAAFAELRTPQGPQRSPRRPRGRVRRHLPAAGHPYRRALGRGTPDRRILPAAPWPAQSFSAWPATRPGPGGLRQLPARIWRGRRLRLVIRALAAVVLSWLALRLVPDQPAGPAAVTGLITWLLLTGRHDLAPPARPVR